MSAQRLGKYEIQGQIAKGARSTLFRGIDTATGQRVAIKVIAHEQLNPRAVAGFPRLAQQLREVDIPSVARFLEPVETQKSLCLVSQLVEGKPLVDLLKDGAHPEPMLAWNVIRQLLEGLAVVHVAHLVHGDIRPSKVIVTAEGRVQLLELGMAPLYAAAPAGVAYFSPEHFGEGKVGARSDLYQMGVLAYQLVTGKVPFTGTAAEIRHRVLEERPTDPSLYNHALAWQLDWVIQKALAKDPADRFASALEFGEGLRLGLQDTVGRPLDPVKVVKPGAQPAAAPAPKTGPAVTATVVQNARRLGEKAATAENGSTPAALAASATQAPPTSAAPAAAPAAAPMPAPKAAAIDPKKPIVLFVDDDARILTAVKALFRQEYNTLTAESGPAALEIAARAQPHIVVSDQRMPGMTGVELLRKMREAAPDAVRILLTGYTDLAALVGSINQGEIFRFVKKPWDNDELRNALADAAKLARKLATTAAPAAEAEAEAPRAGGTLLVIAASEGVGHGLEKLLAGSATVVQAPNAREAAKILARQEIAAIVADMGTGMDGLVALFREVKAKRPNVLSILLTDAPDSELAIDLVNKAQIFRYLPKPVSAKELRTQVAAALRRYAGSRLAAGASRVTQP